MKRSEYFANVQRLYDSEEISEEIYDAMLVNAEEFIDELLEDLRLEQTEQM